MNRTQPYRWLALAGFALASACGGVPESTTRHLVRTNATSTTNFGAVSGTSATDVWAVGSQTTQAIVAHFDGQQWTERTVASAGSLVDVVAGSPTSVWAIGTDLNANDAAFHWDGVSWTPYPLTGCTGLMRIALASPSEPWIACGTDTTIVLRWNATGFDVVDTSMLTDFTTPSGIFGTSPMHMYVEDGTHIALWDGTHWNEFATPEPGGLLGFIFTPGTPTTVQPTSDGQYWFISTRIGFVGLLRWSGVPGATAMGAVGEYAYGPLAAPSATEIYFASSVDSTHSYTTTTHDTHCHHLHHCYTTERTTTNYYPDYVIDHWNGGALEHIRASNHDQEQRIIQIWAASGGVILAVDDSGALWTVQ